MIQIQHIVYADEKQLVHWNKNRKRKKPINLELEKNNYVEFFPLHGTGSDL